MAVQENRSGTPNDALSEHMCHWPLGCSRPVEPRFWACPPHWYSLPKSLRQRIWSAYRPGQEITKTPSKVYIEAIRDVNQWIVENYSEAETGGTPQGALPFISASA